MTTHPTAPATGSPSPGPLAQLAHAQAAAATDDPSEESLAAALAALVGHVDYPCLGARSVFRRDAVTLLVLDDLTDDGPAGDLVRLTVALRDYVRGVDVDGDLVSFVACFRGPVRAGEREFEADLWAALQHLHDTDRTAWSEEVSPDPVDPHFGFSLDGTPLFVVGLHPHASRIARRAPVPTLVFNLHAQFERLRADGRYDRMRDTIRRRDTTVQGSVNPMVADHGEVSEAFQYAGRAVPPDWTPPFHPHPEDRTPA